MFLKRLLAQIKDDQTDKRHYEGINNGKKCNFKIIFITALVL